jgi:hypothetical protein
MKEKNALLSFVYSKISLFALVVIFLLLSSCRVNRNETKGLKAETQKAPKIKKGSFFRNILYGYRGTDDNVIDTENENESEYDYEFEYEEIYD